MNKDKAVGSDKHISFVEKPRIRKAVVTVTDHIFRRHRIEENKLGCKNTTLFWLISKG